MTLPTPFEKDVEMLIRQYRSESAEQHGVARRLHGAERAAAITHANVKSACADALRRLMWNNGLGIDPGKEKKPGGRR